MQGSGAFEVASSLEGDAQRSTRRDTSRSNATSTIVLVEVSGRSVLLTGDAPAPQLARGLARMCAERGVERLPIDLFVVPHNGSAANLDDVVLSLVDVDLFAICTDGSRFHHPDSATIELIARSHPDARIVFNYRSETTERYAEQQVQRELGIRVTFPDADSGVEVSLD